MLSVAVQRSKVLHCSSHIVNSFMFNLLEILSSHHPTLFLYLEPYLTFFPSSSRFSIFILPSLNKILVFCPCWLQIPSWDCRSTPVQNGVLDICIYIFFSCIPYLSLCYRLFIIPSSIKDFSVSRILCHHHFSSLLNQIFSSSLPTKTCTQALRVLLSNHHSACLGNKFFRIAGHQKWKICPVLGQKIVTKALVGVCLSFRQLQMNGRNDHDKSFTVVQRFHFFPNFPRIS